MSYVYGWRLFWGDEEGRISGMITSWPEPLMRAECLGRYLNMPFRREIPESGKEERWHDAALHLMGEQPCPSLSYTCGIYMMPSVSSLTRYSRDYSTGTISEFLAYCKGWGVVNEMEEGYKVQYCEVSALFITHLTSSFPLPKLLSWLDGRPAYIAKGIYAFSEGPCSTPRDALRNLLSRAHKNYYLSAQQAFLNIAREQNIRTNAVYRILPRRE